MQVISVMSENLYNIFLIREIRPLRERLTKILINQSPVLLARSLGERQIPLILIQKKTLLSVHQTAVMIQISVLLHR